MGSDAPHRASQSYDRNTHVTTSNEFTGFDQARHTLWCYEARAHVYLALSHGTFFADGNVAFIHVDNTTRLDRCILTTFDAAGNTLGADTFYNDDARGLEAVSDFVFNTPTHSGDLIAHSGLTQLSDDGWVIDMSALRSYDIIADRRATQRAMVLTLLQDMVVDGDARALLFGSELKGSDATPRLD